MRAFVQYNSAGRQGWLDSLSESLRKDLDVFSGDVRDPNGVATAMLSCDVVFHLAALIGIPYSYYSPDSYVDVNVKGTLNVLQAARRLNTERVLVTSTSETYGTAQFVPITEAHMRQGQSPYSATKIAADSLAESFFRSFELPVTIVRPFNTYGPRQSARAIIPTIITQALAGKQEFKLGSLHPTRDLVFVKDTAQGFIKLAESDLAIGREVNIATETEISMQALAELLIEMTGTRAKLVADEQRIRPERSEVERLLGSARLLQELTGWKPTTSLRDGLAETIAWFRKPENLNRYRPDVYHV